MPWCAQAYSNNLVDYHLILDLIPALSRTYFFRKMPATLSYSQAAILMCLGLQQRELDTVTAALGLPSNQVTPPTRLLVHKHRKHMFDEVLVIICTSR